MDSPKDIKSELEEISPFLSKVDKPAPPILDPAYFENMQAAILSKIAANDEDSKPIINFEPNFAQKITAYITTSRLAYAATLLMLVFGIAGDSSANQFLAWEGSFSSLEENEILNYLSSNVADIDQVLFAFLIDTDASAAAFQDIESDDIEYFLDKNLLDLESEELESLIY